jgi:hypothetical protein
MWVLVALALAAAAPAAPASGPSADLAAARAASRLAVRDPAAAPGAWAEAAAAAERDLRRQAPAWAEAVDAGGDAGAAASRVDAAGAEALYWLALASWEGARARGFAALLSVKDFAFRSMERVAALDERIDHGGPRRALGAWRAGLPAAVGGGAAAARAEFARAREVAPSCPWNRVQEAETLMVLLQDRKGFEALLGEVLAAPPPAGSEAPAPAAASPDAAAPPGGSSRGTASPDDEAARRAEEDEAARRAARDLLGRADRLFR